MRSDYPSERMASVRDRLVLDPLAVVAALIFVSPANAGPTISMPRTSNERFDKPDSTTVDRRELGIVFGSPAAVNLEVGYWLGPIVGVRTSGMFYGKQFWGAQANLCFTVRRRANSRLALALIGGTHQEYRKYWNYGGVAVDWNSHSFFGELGPVILSTDYSNVTDRHAAVVAQIGILGGGGVLGPR